MRLSRWLLCPVGLRSVEFVLHCLTQPKSYQMSSTANTPRFFYHMAKAASWEASDGKEYLGNELDKNDGFIHCSTAKQVPLVSSLFLAGQTDLQLLKIDSHLLPANLLKWETNPLSSDPFPHLYGPLPVSAIVSVRVLPWDEQLRCHLFDNMLSESE